MRRPPWRALAFDDRDSSPTPVGVINLAIGKAAIAPPGSSFSARTEGPGARGKISRFLQNGAPAVGPLDFSPPRGFVVSVSRGPPPLLWLGTREAGIRRSFPGQNSKTTDGDRLFYEVLPFCKRLRFLIDHDIRRGAATARRVGTGNAAWRASSFLIRAATPKWPRV
jgi:hypothetical protein